MHARWMAKAWGRVAEVVSALINAVTGDHAPAMLTPPTTAPSSAPGTVVATPRME